MKINEKVLQEFMGTRVVIAEDHSIFREGLKALLTTLPDIQIVGETNNGRDVVQLVFSLTPDLVLMDITMPGSNGIQAIQKIRKRHSNIKIITLTMHRNEEYVQEALRAGANAYVLKESTWAELAYAISVVSGGMTYLSPAISNLVVSGYIEKCDDQPHSTIWDTLSEREREVLKLIAEGLTNRKVAEVLCLSA
ncbi:MAG: response regulator transcription factor, partial [Gammaproteobacteria bacterium]|nr:response regulator transcription factor [Gammaproteobacteria bacterium]